MNDSSNLTQIELSVVSTLVNLRRSRRSSYTTQSFGTRSSSSSSSTSSSPTINVAGDTPPHSPDDRTDDASLYTSYANYNSTLSNALIQSIVQRKPSPMFEQQQPSDHTSVQLQRSPTTVAAVGALLDLGSARNGAEHRSVQHRQTINGSDTGRVSRVKRNLFVSYARMAVDEMSRQNPNGSSHDIDMAAGETERLRDNARILDNNYKQSCQLMLGLGEKPDAFNQATRDADNSHEVISNATSNSTPEGARALTAPPDKQKSLNIKKRAAHILAAVRKKPAKIFFCDWENCNKSYSKSSHLKTHKDSHLGKKPYHCTYDKCEKKFARSDELTRHAKTHSNVKTHFCMHCEKGFTRSDHLKKHLRTHARKGKESFKGKDLSIKDATAPLQPLTYYNSLHNIPVPTAPSSFSAGQVSGTSNDMSGLMNSIMTSHRLQISLASTKLADSGLRSSPSDSAFGLRAPESLLSALMEVSNNPKVTTTVNIGTSNTLSIAKVGR